MGKDIITIADIVNSSYDTTIWSSIDGKRITLHSTVGISGNGSIKLKSVIHVEDNMDRIVLVTDHLGPAISKYNEI